MSKMKDKPGRKISLTTIIDREAGSVQIIRNLENTKGFLVDSGNMGFLPIDQWRAFLKAETIRASEKAPTLMQTFGFDVETNR